MTPDASSPPRRRVAVWQFSLWRLLALVTLLALLLGGWRLLGSWVLLPAVAGGVLLVSAWVRPRWWFAWLMPLAWLTTAWFNFRHPGDEYGGFAVGSLAGMWILACFDFGNDVNTMLPPVLACGVLTTAVAGLLLDALRAPRVPWVAIWLAVAVGLFLWSFGSYPSVERALMKNGSYAAYVLPSLNLGMYASTLVLLPCTGLYRIVHWALGRWTLGQRAARGLPPGSGEGDARSRA